MSYKVELKNEAFVQVNGNNGITRFRDNQIVEDKVAEKFIPLCPGLFVKNEEKQVLKEIPIKNENFNLEFKKTSIMDERVQSETVESLEKESSNDVLNENNEFGNKKKHRK